MYNHVHNTFENCVYVYSVYDLARNIEDFNDFYKCRNKKHAELNNVKSLYLGPYEKRF